MIKRQELERWFRSNLNGLDIAEYCPNGLQVEGKENISKIAVAVSASKSVIESAVLAKVDALIVHHGIFWKNDWALIKGPFKDKLKLLMNHEINLFAYHLPLDGNMEFGNAVSLAKELHLVNMTPFAIYQSINLGVIAENRLKPKDLFKQIITRINSKSIILDVSKIITKVAIVTGSGENEFQAAISAGANLFISGEGSEWVTHMAYEHGVSFAAVGHHASERFGIQQCAEKIKGTFKCKTMYIENDNPF